MKPVVVLDTNAVHGSKPFTRSDSAVLLMLAKTNRLRLVIPDVVLHELSRQWADSIAESSAKIHKAVNDSNSIMSEVSVPGASVQMPTVDRHHLHKAATAMLVQRGVEIPECPDLAVAALLERDLDRRKPFENSGKGFRDALIWENIRSTCVDLADPATPVILVTDNHSDFCVDSDGELHPDLRGELPDGQRLEVVKRLNLLLQHDEITPLVALLRVQESIDPALLTRLVDDTLAELYATHLDSAVDLYDSDGVYAPPFTIHVDEPSFDEILFDEGTIEFEVFRIDDPDEMTIRVTVEADCTLEGYVSKSDFHLFESGEVAVHEDWNNFVFRASEQHRLRFTLSADFTEDLVEDIVLTVDDVEDVGF